MNNYTINGRVLPIRATLSLPNISGKLAYGHNDRDRSADVILSIIQNEVTIYFDTMDDDIDIFDLKNLCLDFVNSYVASISYFSGIGWHIEITQVLNKEKDINYVYGAETECISQRNEKKDILGFLRKLELIPAQEKLFINRCFSDLQLALIKPIDTPFYCFRGIECLKQLCALRYNLPSEKEQWGKLSELSGKTSTGDLKKFAGEARHGNHQQTTAKERSQFLVSTWELVDCFLDSLIRELSSQNS